ncbi:hypothetical protein F5146DRAFT_1054666 [Armillaria mellea]|nr:hypothetical protein F5146DRAFT_1054666 [Armillaria mellea]
MASTGYRAMLIGCFVSNTWCCGLDLSFCVDFYGEPPELTISEDAIRVLSHLQPTRRSSMAVAARSEALALTPAVL